MVQGSNDSPQKSTVLRVDEQQQEFVFTDVSSEPVPSLLRGFSAPVKMEVKGQTDEQLVFLLANDTGLRTSSHDTHHQYGLVTVANAGSCTTV